MTSKSSTRSVGIILIVIYNILSGLLLFLPAIAVPIFLQSIYEIGEVWVFVIYLVSFLLIVFSMILFLAAYGLWKRKRWGWHLNFWMYLVTILLMPLFLYFDREEVSQSLIPFVIGLSIAFAIVIYLNRMPVKKTYFILDTY